MRQAGLQGVYPSDPRLHALLDSGVTQQELADVAGEAAAKGRGWPWVLATVRGRRDDAARVAQTAATPPAEPPGPRPETDQERYAREERERQGWTPEQKASNVAARERAMALARQALRLPIGGRS
jgi:hypothetical protein